MGKAEDWAMAFHGRPFIVRRNGKKLVVIGYLEAIEYLAPAGSKRAGVRWRHNIGDNGSGRPKSDERPLLVADPATGRVQILRGRSDLRFDPRRGLVG